MKTESRIYVGTYGKYNSGSLYGAWLDLADYSGKEEFYDACAELHKGEHDPEYMFQDWEGIPERFISESGLSPDYWEYRDMVEDSYLDADVWEAAEDAEIAPNDVEEAYSGRYSTDEDFAYDMAEQLGELNESAGWPHSCIDWERAARDLMWDYTESNHHYFRSM